MPLRGIWGTAPALVISIAAIAVGAVVGWVYTQIFDIISQPIRTSWIRRRPRGRDVRLVVSG